MLKKFLIGTFALALMLTVATSVDAFSGVTLKLGSRGADVMELQTLVGATPVDGIFGNMTKAKVMAWQASNGLVADGVFGPASIAKATAGGSTGGTSCPAGTFDPMTGLPCGTTGGGTNLPAGCTSTAGYSVTTGAKCDGSTTPSTPTTLTGEGSVKDYSVGSAEETSTAEGESNVELVAFDVELEDDGDLKLDRFDLYMGEDNDVTTQSTKPWDYFKSVSLMVDGVKVASMDVDSKGDWSESSAIDLDSDQEYRLRFSGLNAVLKSDETTEVAVSFDITSNIDSDDEDATWNYGIISDSFRFVDGTGFVFTDGDALDDSFTFDTADMAEIEISKNTSSDPDASVIEVSKTSDTNGVTLAVIDIEEVGGVDVNITEMTVTLDSPSSETETDMVKKLYLYDGSTLLGQETVTGTVVTFDNVDFDIDADDTLKVTIKADLDDTNDGVRYQNADTIKVDAVDVTELTDSFDNDEGDIDVTSDYDGNTHALYTDGISVSLVGTPTISKSTATIAGESDIATAVIKIEVSAFGANMYLAEIATAASGLPHVVAASDADVDIDLVDVETSADLVGDGYEIAKGDSEEFEFTIVMSTDETTSQTARALFTSFAWDTVSTGGADGSNYTFNLDDFKSPSTSIKALPAA